RRRPFEQEPGGRSGIDRRRVGPALLVAVEAYGLRQPPQDLRGGAVPPLDLVRERSEVARRDLPLGGRTLIGSYAEDAIEALARWSRRRQPYGIDRRRRGTPGRGAERLRPARAPPTRTPARWVNQLSRAGEP